MLTPSNGSAVSGVVSIDVNASDESGIARMDFYYYGPSLSYQLVGSDDAAPYSMGWNTSRVVDGKYYLFVEVFDVYGNKKTTEDALQRVYVFVNNTHVTTTTSTTTSTSSTTSSTSSTSSFASTTTTTTTGNGTSTTLPRIPGDADGDRHVNYIDLIILGATYGQDSAGTGYDVRADYNEDGVVNYSDLVILAANYGRWA